MSLTEGEQRKSFQALFDVVYKGDESATELSFKILEVLDIWDDIVDKDKQVDDNDINSAFLGAIFELQRNPLWFKCGLDHHILNVFLRWRDSNAMEADKDSTENDLLKCWMLRAGLYDLFVIIAYHLHGDEWSRRCGPAVRKAYGETYKDFLKEMKEARDA